MRTKEKEPEAMQLESGHSVGLDGWSGRRTGRGGGEWGFGGNDAGVRGETNCQWERGRKGWMERGRNRE